MNIDQIQSRRSASKSVEYDRIIPHSIAYVLPVKAGVDYAMMSAMQMRSGNHLDAGHEAQLSIPNPKGSKSNSFQL